MQLLRTRATAATPGPVRRISPLNQIEYTKNSIAEPPLGSGADHCVVASETGTTGTGNA